MQENIYQLNQQINYKTQAIWNLTSEVEIVKSQFQIGEHLKAENIQLKLDLENLKMKNYDNLKILNNNYDIVKVENNINSIREIAELQGQLQILKGTIQDKDDHINQLELQIIGQKNLHNGIVQKPNSQFIEMIIRKAFQNQNQKKGDTSKLEDTDYYFNSFDSEQNLLKTLPRKLLKTLDLFIDIHGFFPDSYLSNYKQSGFLKATFFSIFSYGKYNFDMNGAVFNGPFGNAECLLVEQQQADRPKFYFKWKPNDPTFLEVVFCDSTGEKNLYYIMIISSKVFLRDCTAMKRIHEYQIKDDGNLGEKII